jgi:hypothetical protein
MPPKIFKGQVFAISGAFSQPRKDIEELIQKHGGEVAASVTKSVTFLLTTPADITACTQKVATAKGRSVPLVQEGFIGACITAKKLLDPNFFAVEAKTGVKRKSVASATGSSASASPPPAPDTTKAGPPKAVPVVAAVTRARPVSTTDAVSVIAKSGLADKSAVVKEDTSKGFMKASLTWDVELVLSDPLAGKDKFYCMQLLASAGADGSAQQFWAVQHWGRTGCDGRVHVDGPYEDVTSAKKVFRKKFRAKTGNPWGILGGTFVDVPGKHKILLKGSDRTTIGIWQYYLHNAIDGKSIGWYSYEEGPAAIMEKQFCAHKANPGLDVRYITTGYFTYEVDFRNMTQTNTKSGTRRAIRRIEHGEVPSDAPPSVIPTAVKPKPEVAAAESSAEEEEGEGEDEEEEEQHEEAEALTKDELAAEDHEDVDDDATIAGDLEDDDAETLVMGGSNVPLPAEKRARTSDDVNID